MPSSSLNLLANLVHCWNTAKSLQLLSTKLENLLKLRFNTGARKNCGLLRKSSFFLRRKILLSHPNDAVTLVNLGACLNEQQKFKESAEFLEAARLLISEKSKPIELSLTLLHLGEAYQVIHMFFPKIIC